jgi:flagellar basal-body rod protein FlgC
MNIIAENLANTNTTKTEEGGPYKRKIVRFFELVKTSTAHKAVGGNELAMTSTQRGHIRTELEVPFTNKFSGVRMDTVRDNADPDRIYDPNHPDADEFGYVAMPKIDTIVEMVDMISASRAYEANVQAISAAKDMARKALEI